jgi:GNAT superfamily N-acetyltransferase
MRGDDAAAVADLATQLGYPSTGEEVRERFVALAASEADGVLVAVDEGDVPIGWIHVARQMQLVASDRATIGGLVVADGHRSAGVGTELLAAAEAWARDHGARVMSVRSRSTRERAHRFYQRSGYELIKLSHVFEKPLV